MSDENTVGHYKSHPLGEVIESLRTKTETLQQVVFEKDKTILEWRCELIGISARLRAANLDLFALEIEGLIGADELKSARYDGGWISVKDRLPEEKVRVLILHSYSVGEPNASIATRVNDSWISESGRQFVTTISHWHELPQPPKEVSTFADHLSSGEGIKRGQPVLALRNFLINGGPVNRTWTQQKTTLIESVANAVYNTVSNESIVSIRRGQNGLKFFSAKQRANVTKVRLILGLTA